MKNTIRSIVEKQLHTKVRSVSECGKGASGSVYKVRISTEPFVLAVKSSRFFDNMVKEKNMLNFSKKRIVSQNE